MAEQPDLDKRTRERLTHGARDMTWSLLVLLPVIGLIAAFFGACEFSPGGPTVDQGAVRTVDADQALRRSAVSTGFALRSPAVPAGWRATAANTGPVGSGADGNVVARVSWITDTGRYLRLAQSPASAELVVTDEGEVERPRPEGEVKVGERAWTVYPWRENEKAWVTSLDGVQLMVAGTGTVEEFRALAGAVQSAEPLPAR